MSDEERAAESTDEAALLVEIIKPVLAHREPEVVGGVLGQLLAILIAGHSPELRAEILAMVLGIARELVPIEIEQMIEAGQVGEEWRGTKQ
ncbi:hypothetical protein A1D31_22225 [Bradyrhizobium liaoningense]|nr:hypothetical protein A1D31_22225 [Bradyrhizobium liaoningense]